MLVVRCIEAKAEALSVPFDEVDSWDIWRDDGTRLYHIALTHEDGATRFEGQDREGATVFEVTLRPDHSLAVTRSTMNDQTLNQLKDEYQTLRNSQAQPHDQPSPQRVR